MKTIRRASLVLAAALSLAACGGDEQPSGVIAREKFVAANVAVRSLPDGATAAERAAVLRKHGVTDRQLKAWVNGHARNPETLAKAWEEIAFKLDSAGNPSMPPVPRPSSTPPGSRVPPTRPQGMRDTGMAAPPPPPAATVGEPRAEYPRRKRVRQVQ
ncbi:MAG TPA: hypothetical protein VF006_08525 [Longimicrobium sp.]